MERNRAENRASQPGEFVITIKNMGIDEEEDKEEGAENEPDVDEEENYEEYTVEEEDNPQLLRRSQRVSTRPSHLDDYVLLAEIESERLLMAINEEPWDYDEAKKLKVWIDACKDEISSIEKNKTWDLVCLPAGAKAIGLKWVFKVKRNADGSINKFKARLVAKGYVQKHVLIMMRSSHQWLALRQYA